MARSRHTQGFWNAERFGWAFYDWANSAFVLCIVTVIGPAYFVAVFEEAARQAGGRMVGPALALEVAGLRLTAEAAWSFTISAASLVVALSSPLLGAIADARGLRKRFLMLYAGAGVAATLALAAPGPWWLVAALILVGTIGFEGGNVYYNAYLPDVASPAQRDMLSSWGFALGYVGGVLALALCLAFFVPPRGDIHLSFVLVGLWWGGFALIPALLVRARPGRLAALPLGRLVARAWGEIVATVRGVRRTPNAGLFLLAFLLYNDGIATLISNATPFALQNVYLDDSLTAKVGLAQLIPAIMLVQVVAFPGSLVCGWAAGRFGEKRTIYACLAVFTAVVGYGQVVHTLREFYVMAGLIGLVLGGAQAISRSLYAQFVPPAKNAEFFSFFALSERVSAMFGPLAYGLSLIITGDTRVALLSLTVFFVAGAAVLTRVDVARGRADALRA
ncbi:MAG: MFS transporter [Candidatus Lambdaproteobacteria bacterium]|nr:MFS transporter [Candidatus Lambdaproteobacteria bacterium]